MMRRSRLSNVSGTCPACRCYGRLPATRNRPEREAQHSPTKPFKAFTDNAGAVALLLGVILSALSLYDILVRRPEADRIAAITQFNQAVNSAAKTRQELIQANNSTDQAQRLAITAMATPRILNDIATARALLPTLNPADVGVPQLLILINEALTAGDFGSAEAFVARALNNKTLSPYMRSEALRYKGKFLFVSGDPASARASYREAISSLGTGLALSAARAYAIADLIAMQLAVGSCHDIAGDMEELAQTLQSPGVSVEVRSQIAATVRLYVSQYGTEDCALPTGVSLGGASK